MANPTEADAFVDAFVNALNSGNSAEDQPYGSEYVPLHHWVTDKLHPKDWGETPPQAIYDTIYPLEYITAPCRQRPETPEGVDAEWRRLTDDDGLVYWHRVG